MDQKLLTLLHFNLVRALNENVLMLGLDPGAMSDDLESPFFCNESGEGLELVQKLPPTLRPTEIQRSIKHHPEIDVFPFPKYRDNLIMAGDKVDDVELCVDLLYGVDLHEDVAGKRRSCHDGPYGTAGRTGMIIWSEPWMESSWEVDEGFARKYRGLLEGCEELIRSTNFWREKRGEGPLVLDD